MIIGIGHVARSGKDTAAAALCQHEGFVKVAFADALRELAMKADPLVNAGQRPQNVAVGHGRLAWVIQGMGYEQAKDTFKEVRRFLQALGVGAREVFGDDVWVNEAMRRATSHRNVVMPDVRFLNEAQSIQARGGKVIRIHRPGYLPGGHVSETALAEWTGWDATVVNDGSVVDLERKIVEVVRGFIRAEEREAGDVPAAD